MSYKQQTAEHLAHFFHTNITACHSQIGWHFSHTNIRQLHQNQGDNHTNITDCYSQTRMMFLSHKHQTYTLAMTVFLPHKHDRKLHQKQGDMSYTHYRLLHTNQDTIFLMQTFTLKQELYFLHTNTTGCNTQMKVTLLSQKHTSYSKTIMGRHMCVHSEIHWNRSSRV